MNIGKRFIAYVLESRDELKKVIWPSRKETVRSTIQVIAISLFVAAFLGFLDILLNLGLKELL